MRVTGISSSGPSAFHKENLEKARAREREMKLREEENKRIEELRAQISKVAGSDMKKEAKEAKINILSDQITAIFETRAERERLAAEREMEERKRELKEKQREQEKAAEKMKVKNSDPKDAILREDIAGMVKLAVSADGIHKFKQTKALREAEAERLEQDIENDWGLMQVGLDITIKTKITDEFPNSFRQRNLAKLKEGISKLDDTINEEIGKLNGIREDWVEDRKETAINGEASKDKNDGEIKKDSVKTEEKPVELTEDEII